MVEATQEESSCRCEEAADAEANEDDDDDPLCTSTHLLYVPPSPKNKRTRDRDLRPRRGPCWPSLMSVFPLSPTPTLHPSPFQQLIRRQLATASACAAILR